MKLCSLDVRSGDNPDHLLGEVEGKWISLDGRSRIDNGHLASSSPTSDARPSNDPAVIQEVYDWQE
jgi:hypothetical protein